MIRHAAQIDKDPRHAGDHLAIFDNGIEIVGIGERLRQVMTDLGDAGLDIERGIPCAAVRGVEAIGLARLGVCKARIDKSGMRHAVNQFVGCKCAMASFLGNKTRTGRAFDLCEQRKLFIIVGKRSHDRFAQTRAGNEPDRPLERFADLRRLACLLKARHEARRYTVWSLTCAECRLRSLPGLVSGDRTPAPCFRASASGRPCRWQTAGAAP